jgi:hypothetical protein
MEITMPIKTKLIELMQSAMLEEQAFAGGFGEQGVTAEGTLERWTAKDLLAHIRAWKENMIEGLDATAHGRPTAWDGDTDATNARVFEQHRNDSWDQVTRDLSETNRRLLETVQMMSDLELMDPGRNPWRNKRPAWVSIAGNSFSHPVVHIAQYAFEHGDSAHGTLLNEMIAERLLAMDDSPAWKGNALYNLACAYALGSQCEKAIANLREALSHNPELSEWSQKDPDLEPLHGNPEYEALFGS